MYDVIVIGGGPAGLSAALNFGRGLTKTLVIDEDRPRNRVTTESHGYLTQDGVTPSEFKANAQKDLEKYADVSLVNDRVINIQPVDDYFNVTSQNETYQAKQILLATGLRETYPDIKNLADFYGKSVYYCPWCDGYELRHRKLAVMVDDKSVHHMPMLLSNWADDLLVCTNGQDVLTDEIKDKLTEKGFSYKEAVITEMTGQNGQIDGLLFADGSQAEVEGMLSSVIWDTNYDFIQELTFDRGDQGEFITDPFGETSIPGIFVAGEAKRNFASQLINAAADGADVAKFMMMKRLQTNF
ncbi:NAD(P)/FAD-dependent oxidoreductase [Aerococcaceae bacterium 50-4]